MISWGFFSVGSKNNSNYLFLSKKIWKNNLWRLYIWIVGKRKDGNCLKISIFSRERNILFSRWRVQRVKSLFLYLFGNCPVGGGLAYKQAGNCAGKQIGSRKTLRFPIWKVIILKKKHWWFWHVSIVVFGTIWTGVPRKNAWFGSQLTVYFLPAQRAFFVKDTQHKK